MKMLLAISSPLLATLATHVVMSFRLVINLYSSHLSYLTANTIDSEDIFNTRGKHNVGIHYIIKTS